jgi:uncharacterized protein (DUF58 family)
VRSESAAPGSAPEVARAGAPDALLRRLEWTVLRRLDGIQHGDHRSAYRGTGVDIIDLRPYEPSDEVRHIDWNVTARMDEPYVREFAEDREIAAWLLIDRTASMTLGPAGRTKERLAVELAVSLARLLGRGGNRVGAMVLTEGPPAVIRPAAGRRQTLRIASELLRPSAPTKGATDLGRLLLPAAAALRRRSAVFVISDFVTVPGWERGLQMLARRHDLTVVEVVDRFERQLPDIGVLTVEDAETGAQVEIDTGNAAFRRRHAALVAERIAEVDQVMRGAGVIRSILSTTDDLVTALTRLMSTRAARQLVRANR